MRISRVYHTDGFRVQVVAGLPPMWRLGMVLLAISGLLIAWFVHKLDPGGLKHFVPLGFAVIALAMGLGRFVYVIRPNAYVRFRLSLFGVPVLSQVVKASSFHSMEITEDQDGLVTLCFRDPAGNLRLTLSGFATWELAERVGGLFRIDESREAAAIRGFIEEVTMEQHWFSRWSAALLVFIVFCVMPGLSFLMGYTMDEAGYPTAAGAFLVFVTAYALRRDSGVLSVADDRSHIDRWTRHGWFRIMEYRQHLGEHAGQSMLRLRWDRAAWLIPLLLLAQAGCVVLACQYNTQLAREYAAPYRATPEFYDSEAVRQGAERFRQFQERRKE